MSLGILLQAGSASFLQACSACSCKQVLQAAFPQQSVLYFIFSTRFFWVTSRFPASRCSRASESDGSSAGGSSDSSWHRNGLLYLGAYGVRKGFCEGLCSKRGAVQQTTAGL